MCSREWVELQLHPRVSFAPFDHLLVLQQSDIAITSGASVLGGSIGFGPLFALLGDYFEIKK